MVAGEINTFVPVHRKLIDLAHLSLNNKPFYAVGIYLIKM